MTDTQLLAAYLTAVGNVHASGANSPETSYYAALSNLFEAVGNTLKPKVKCVMNLRNHGNGFPDGGLFTADQLSRRTVETALAAGQLPARGAIEVKGAAADLDALAASEQVERYLQTYGIVLITNLRQFAIVDRNGVRERYSLADSAAAFWDTVAAHPAGSAERHAALFAEFLRRACLHDAPLATPKDFAWFLASYARDALARVERQRALPALASVRTALEQALGMTFTGEDGEHFFRSTLVQTLFYGVFSAWVKWCEDAPPIAARFDWRTAAWTLHVPFVRSLFGMIAQPSTLGPLGLVEPIEWAAGALNRVDRDAFFTRFEKAYAVQYFYEPFLEAYDPQLRKDLGVWYTPPEVVKYQVARVDRVLREELGLADGLANPDVVVLDPCCGTGAYLVEVLKTIAATLKTNGGDALSGADLKAAATGRVFGFEIMPAPFVVAHLQLGLLLQNEGAPLDLAANERVGVYLTNALTGWEPPAAAQQLVLSNFLDLKQEKDAAEAVKRGQPILVILGNPPYNGFAAVAVGEERSLSTSYRIATRAPAPEGQGLNELYVRFFRMAERRIAEMSGRGIVCFISNYSWLDGRSHNGMRERLITAFNTIHIDCLNGDRYRTGKLTPAGEPDPSIFSTPFNREGIQVGAAIATCVLRLPNGEDASVNFRNFWGSEKLADLRLESETDQLPNYTRLEPRADQGFPFVPMNSATEYTSWPTLENLLPASFPGVQSKQDSLVVDIELERLQKRIGDFFDSTISNDELARLHPGSMDGSNACDAAKTRAFLINRGIRREYFVKYTYKPLDRRYIYWEAETNLLGRKSPDFFPNVMPRNRFLEARRRESVADWSRGTVTSNLADNFGNGFSNFFPLLLRNQNLFDASTSPFNLSNPARDYLRSLEVTDESRIFFHSVAAMNTPSFRAENASTLRNDWPRIPLPATREALEASAALGERVAALLDTEADVPGVTSSTLSPVLRTVGGITKTGGGAIDPNGDDLALTVNWGHAGQKNVTMPGRGKTETRPFADGEQQALAAEAAATGQSPDALTALLGGQTLDVYLNDGVYWRNVPAAAWEFYIGGYQVMKKWLSYREADLLGRSLTVAEAREVTAMARRLTTLVLLRPALDANYAAVAAATYAWPAAGTTSVTAGVWVGPTAGR